ncbi:DNA polymerase III subunit gamma/tau [Caviibacterium pharyngocola]|uniref:DNA polymerase III subunit gamma/tau n=1 Tax=Caviibacterium pharyngocola TaxID=28159 RepID=A0A2M8RTN3_9PAST|nr:DNA polymerase III subunit gamma/tau [Caviibacterium pharyngocola]PJG82242.1 DNA polymerase III subunit gamma/tau [Caviibacterium pharyngocola]
MSYQVLARKWRPKNFAEVVGQSHILTALSNGLKENRLHHAYLFSGTRGVGKTSIARLFAKGLNCINGVTADPCGACEHCKAIEEGRFIDLIEIDAASRTKVEDTRELLDNVQYKPTQGRYKVYLIDEVHMLSRHSFNALLKTLEEPPEYVKFLLATTDPHKLPITILSRCMQFHLKALEQPQIAAHLAHILDAEGIAYESLATEKLAKAAQGSIRDGLSLTDQAIAMTNGNITLSAVNEMLGLLDDNQPVEILYALQQGNGEALMKCVQSVAEQGGDWEELLNAVAENLHKIAMRQLLAQGRINDEGPIGFLAKHISPEDVQFFYQIIVNGRKELAFSPDRRTGAEMVLLRALAFHPKLIAPIAVQSVDAPSVSPISAPVVVPQESAPKLVEMPVVSQAVKATYSSQSGRDTATNLSDNSALAALDALEQLSKPVSDIAVSADSEKKNRNLRKSAEPLTPQNVISPQPSDSAEPIATPQTAETAKSNESAVENHAENDGENEENYTAETYRWEWINPEMAKEQTAVRPSEIKQAILQEMTPELHQRIIQTARQRDEWTNIVEQIDIVGLAKEMAINCFILQQTENRIRLGLRSSHSHLNREKNYHALNAALNAFYQKPLELVLEENDDAAYFTPADYRHSIYQEFSQQAKQDLQQDKKIQLLQKEFAANLDLESIRPV